LYPSLFNFLKNNKGATTSLAMTTGPEGNLPPETAAIARKFSGTRRVAIVRIPRLVVGSFQ